MIRSVIRVLLIEDDPSDTLLLRESVRDDALSSFEFAVAEDLKSALKLLRENQFDVILLDLGLPDSQGLKSFETIRHSSPSKPVVVLSVLSDETLALEAVQAGAQDYLVKGPAGWEIAPRSIRYAIERKRMEEDLLHMATHDSLTRLPNRKLFFDRLAHSIERSRRSRKDKSEKWELAVMLLDLDNFKSANDTYGHNHGDILLQFVSELLKNTVRESDTVARMGGDEFTIIFENVNGKEDAGILARKVLAVFDRPFLLRDNEFKLTASIGISLYPQDGQDAEALLTCADIAMYRAKRYKNTFRFCADPVFPNQ
jgi:diguanylate cyclase (GGDEF)-like protein